jgi:hypothetical protein
MAGKQVDDRFTCHPGPWIGLGPGSSDRQWALSVEVTDELSSALKQNNKQLIASSARRLEEGVNMKPFISQNANCKGWKLALLITAALLLFSSASAWADRDGQESRENKVKIVRPSERFHGQSYAQWSAAWWQWAMSQPLAGHPFVDDPSFNVASGQSGNVWFLASPFGTLERQVTIPRGKSLVIGLLNAEWSDLEEPGASESVQREAATFQADHISNVSCSVDGKSVGNMGDFRTVSPQFTFLAPTPWIFGPTGGAGTAVADGYYVILKSLSKGLHTVRIQGSFHFAVAEGDPFDFDAEVDLTYRITVRDNGHGHD